MVCSVCKQAGHNKRTCTADEEENELSDRCSSGSEEIASTSDQDGNESSGASDRRRSDIEGASYSLSEKIESHSGEDEHELTAVRPG